MMPEEHVNRPNIFVGSLNLDDDLTIIEPQDFIYATAIRNTAGAVPGAVTNIQGNVEIPNTLLPAGNNTCIGVCEDKRGSTVFFFVHNDNGNHCIFRYYPNNTSTDPNGEVQLILQSSALNFNADWKVHSARYVDNKFLYWVDNFSEKASIEGNPPYKINAEKGNQNKAFTYELIAGLPDQNQFATTLADNNTIVVRVQARNGTGTVGQIVLTAAQLNTYVNDPYGFLAYITSRIQANAGLNALMSVNYCEECRVELALYSSLYYLEIFETNPPTPNKNILFIRVNHYPDVVRQEHLDVIKWPPVYELTSRYIVEPAYPANNVNQTIFQFRVRYWFDDGEKSAWGPISLLCLPIDKAGVFLEGLNAIELDFTDSRLNDPDSLNIIRKVELAFREGNDGLFRSIDVLDICEIGINQQIYLFRNDKTYSVVSSDDTAVSGQTQALKLFDAVPRIAGAMEVMSDREGNNRLFYGANLENYNNPECLDLQWEFETNPEDECFITISGKVEINYLAVQKNDGYFRSRMIDVGVPGDPNELVLEGFVVYLVGTDYYGISKSFEVPSVPTPTGLFEIRNVPRGRYLMRVANWRCRFDDTKGAIYNLNNGIAWQKTSAPVLDCAGSVADTGVWYERYLDLTTAGPTFDLMTEPGYGPIVIQDFEIGVSFNPDLAELSGAEIYFLDNDAKGDTEDERKGGIGVERQKVSFNGNSALGSINIPFLISIGGAVGNLETDHNGYVWAVWNTAGRFARPTINTTEVTLTFIEVRDPCASTTRELVYDLPQGIKAFSGGLEGIWLGTAVDTGGDGLKWATSFTPDLNNAWQFTVFNFDTDFTTKNKTTINGTIVEQTNTPVPNVLAFYTRNGRPQFTDTIGGYSITVYCPWDSDNRIDDTLYVTYPTDNCYNYPPNPFSQVPNISNFCTNPYDSTHPYNATQVVMPFVGAIVQVARYLKRGGVYRTGIVYEDRANRKATVIEGPTLRIPYFTESGGGFTRASAFWSINSIPPEWATHYRIVLTDDGYYRRYLQWIVESVEYARIESIGASPVPTSFANGDATHVMIQISALITETDPSANPVEWFFMGTNLQGFSAQPGDRIRLILDEAGNLVITNGIYDFEIVGIYRNGTDYFVVIETPEIFREIKASWLVELYTPKRNDEVVFYEMGDTHPILNPHLPTRAHGGSTQNQIPNTQPATGFLAGGDTYWRNKNFSVDDTASFTYQVENASITDRFDSTFTDKGRPNIKDDDFGERFYFNRIRFSGIYIPNSKINGLSAFRQIDVQSLDMRYGNIMKLIAADNVMLSICQFKTQPIYVAKDRILDLSGAGSVGRSDAILNLADELKYDMGTQNPESVIEQDGHVYAIDLFQGVVWRYSMNGQFPVSEYKAKRYFKQLGNQLYKLDRRLTRVYGFYERKFSLYGLTFAPNQIQQEGETIQFSEEKNRWNNFQPFVGEYYCAIGDKMVSFSRGRIFLHDAVNQVYNTFFGVLHRSRIKFVSNQLPRAVKQWWNISIQADNQWICPTIRVQKNFSYPFGMLSELSQAHFTNEEGVWKADFLRDSTDPDPRFNSITNPVERQIAKLLRGRGLTGEILIIEIELLNSSEFSLLKRVDVEWTASMDTKA